MNYFNNNNQMLNQLMRQRDSIENLIGQYSQMQTPIQNVINTNGVDLEAKVLVNGEDPSNIMVTRRTLFVDEKNSKVMIKELDGSISKEYQIIVPKDEKDQKIEDLEKEINKLKEVIGNNELSNVKSSVKIEPAIASVTKSNGK